MSGYKGTCIWCIWRIWCICISRYMLYLGWCLTNFFPQYLNLIMVNLYIVYQRIIQGVRWFFFALHTLYICFPRLICFLWHSVHFELLSPNITCCTNQTFEKPSHEEVNPILLMVGEINKKCFRETFSNFS